MEGTLRFQRTSKQGVISSDSKGCKGNTSARFHLRYKYQRAMGHYEDIMLSLKAFLKEIIINA